jgi:O6-methylguanine-DNA--protein-cysteine methyltransferase
MMSIRHIVIDSPLGPLTLVVTGDYLSGLYFRRHHRRPDASTLGGSVALESDALLGQAAGQLEEYFTAQRTYFDLPLSLIGSDCPGRSAVLTISPRTIRSAITPATRQKSATQPMASPTDRSTRMG